MLSIDFLIEVSELAGIIRNKRTWSSFLWYQVLSSLDRERRKMERIDKDVDYCEIIILLR